MAPVVVSASGLEATIALLPSPKKGAPSAFEVDLVGGMHGWSSRGEHYSLGSYGLTKAELCEFAKKLAEAAEGLPE